MTARRRGYSLMEVLAVMAVLSVLLGLAAGLAHALRRVERTVRSASVDGDNVARVARQFRRDAHAALRAELIPGPGKMAAGIAFALPRRGRAEYRPDGASLSISHRVPDGAARQERIRFESFSATAVELETSRELATGRLLFSPTIGPGKAGGTRLETTIEAVVGRDHRMQGKRATR